MVNRTLRYILLAIFVGVPLANFGLEPFLSEGNQFADDPETRVSAAGYAFAIWGVIFSGMLWFSASLAFGREPDSQALKKAIVCLSIAGCASIAFVPISIYCNATIVWIDILLHLIPLALAAIFLRRHVASTRESVNALSRWSFFGPSMYLGWICAATVISTSLMANELGVELSEPVATGLSIFTLVVLGAISVYLTLVKDVVYGATVCWALVAVGVNQVSYPLIQYIAWSAAATTAIVILVVLIGSRTPFYATAE